MVCEVYVGLPGMLVGSCWVADVPLQRTQLQASSPRMCQFSHRRVTWPSKDFARCRYTFFGGVDCLQPFAHIWSNRELTSYFHSVDPHLI